MQYKMVLAIFWSVFLAELGDKTQLATLCFAAEGQCKPWEVFLASAGALVCSTFIAVMVGSQLNRFVNPQYLKLIAGAAFILIGGWVLYDSIRSL